MEREKLVYVGYSVLLCIVRLRLDLFLISINTRRRAAHYDGID